MCSFFYANEGHAPMHVHVRHADGYAKFWMGPFQLAYSVKMKVRELTRAETLAKENRALIRRKWNEVHHR